MIVIDNCLLPSIKRRGNLFTIWALNVKNPQTLKVYMYVAWFIFSSFFMSNNTVAKKCSICEKEIDTAQLPSILVNDEKVENNLCSIHKEKFESWIKYEKELDKGTTEDKEEGNLWIVIWIAVIIIGAGLLY